MNEYTTVRFERFEINRTVTETVQYLWIWFFSCLLCIDSRLRLITESGLPVVVEPSGETQMFGKRSTNLTMTCIVHGKPPPAISWRYNWGSLREGVKHVINNTVVDCNTVISHLTLIDLEPEAGGLYTCEAVNKGRTLAPDFSLNVARKCRMICLKD